jgi:hypothetical protein
MKEYVYTSGGHEFLIEYYESAQTIPGSCSQVKWKDQENNIVYKKYCIKSVTFLVPLNDGNILPVEMNESSFRQVSDKVNELLLKEIEPGFWED